MVDNMDFKEILQDDINNAFLDSSEFAEVHNLNGQEVNIVIDDNVTDGTETGIYGISQKLMMDCTRAIKSFISRPRIPKDLRPAIC